MNRDRTSSASPRPFPLCLSHFFSSSCAGAEILIEEVDPVVAARQAQEAEAARLARVAEQEAQGEALRRAQEMSVTASRRAAAAATGSDGK
jgi:hypothetical protein